MPPTSGYRWAAALVAAAGVLLLLSLAALATHAAYSSRLVPGSRSSPGGLSSTLVGVSGEVVVTVFLALVDVAILLTLFLMPWSRFRRVGKSGAPVAKMSRSVRAKMVALAGSLVLAEVLVLFLTLRSRSHPLVGIRPPSPTAIRERSQPGTVQVGDALLVGAALAIVAAAIIVGYVVYRRRQSSHWRSRMEVPPFEPELPEELAVALDAGLDELGSGADPRLAVILAYSQMERALGQRGVARASSETHLEYLERALLGLRASQYSLRKLTELFELARFSHHEVGPVERADAERALARLRDELRGAPA